jgi:hypothetical protein
MLDMEAGRDAGTERRAIEGALRITGLEALASDQVPSELEEILIRAACLRSAALAPNTLRASSARLHDVDVGLLREEQVRSIIMAT